VPLLDYELWVGEDTTWTKCASYDYASDGFTYAVEAAENSMIAGSYYHFKYRALNDRGYSDFSDVLTVGLGPLPSQPTGLARSTSGNNITSIALEWEVLVGETLDIGFYTLFVDDGQGIIFTQAYQGSLSRVIVNQLKPGTEYSFYVTATNFNGEGVRSDILRLKSCVAPIGVYPPIVLSTTAQSIALRWEQPDSDGGCQISSF
jgi:hypothetical protein